MAKRPPSLYKRRKAIIAHHFESQRRKNRGSLTEPIGHLLTSMEIELIADLKAFQKDPDKDPYKLIPKPDSIEKQKNDYLNKQSDEAAR